MKRIRCSNGQYTLVSHCDWHYLKRYSWRVDHKGYVIASHGRRMNRIVAIRIGLVIAGLQVDHINRRKRDNQRRNLRVATNGQNRANSKCHNRTGFRGVILRPALALRDGRKRRSDYSPRFTAQITVNGKKIWLGDFHTPIDAAKAYDRAAKHQHGEFATLNFPK